MTDGSDPERRRRTHTWTLTRPGRMTLTQASVESIRVAIADGIFPGGSRLPTEKDLVTKLGVSRTTLREALRALEEAHLIVRRHGIGRFVVNAPITKDLSANFGITAMMRQGGHEPHTAAAEVRHTAATAEIANSLQIDVGAPTLTLERLRLVGSKPVVWSLDIMPTSMVSRRDIDSFIGTEDSLYDFLSRIGIVIVRGAAELKPKAADNHLAKKLQVTRGTALMCVLQTDYDPLDHPVLYSVEYHVPDLVIFRVNRSGPHSAHTQPGTGNSQTRP